LGGYCCKTQNFRKPIFLQKPIATEIVSLFTVGADQSIIHGDKGVNAVPPAQMLQLSPEKLIFRSQPWKMSFSTASANSGHWRRASGIFAMSPEADLTLQARLPQLLPRAVIFPIAGSKGTYALRQRRSNPQSEQQSNKTSRRLPPKRPPTSALASFG
jgi:hypothetical protein